MMHFHNIDHFLNSEFRSAYQWLRFLMERKDPKFGVKMSDWLEFDLLCRSRAKMSKKIHISGKKKQKSWDFLIE